ncbi:MAG TPA: hypothetical protein ENK44_13305 [Caldithrix abyssi]|uniref:AbrB/MazE/SpoVT family DNA-binding domain-containing protein n=1 Tax=Caldithrix abyssi TaxID=187145 RepID=A0A7V4U4F4_CALAY|nr:hypothetical protein [Caldithrix abyssi]
MLSGTFICQLDKKNQIEIPGEVIARLRLNEGDKVEVMVKKIRSRRLDIKISKNPLLKLLDLQKG